MTTVLGVQDTLGKEPILKIWRELKAREENENSEEEHSESDDSSESRPIPRKSN